MVQKRREKKVIMKITFCTNWDDSMGKLKFDLIDFKKVENIEVIDPSLVRITAIW